MGRYESKIRTLAEGSVVGTRFQNLIRRWEQNREPPPAVEAQQPYVSILLVLWPFNSTAHTLADLPMLVNGDRGEVLKTRKKTGSMALMTMTSLQRSLRGLNSNLHRMLPTKGNDRGKVAANLNGRTVVANPPHPHQLIALVWLIMRAMTTHPLVLRHLVMHPPLTKARVIVRSQYRKTALALHCSPKHLVRQRQDK